jgi:hypothetical protein
MDSIMDLSSVQFRLRLCCSGCSIGFFPRGSSCYVVSNLFTGSALLIMFNWFLGALSVARIYACRALLSCGTNSLWAPLVFLSFIDALQCEGFVLFFLSNSGVGKICGHLNLSILSCGFSLTFVWGRDWVFWEFGLFRRGFCSLHHGALLE